MAPSMAAPGTADNKQRQLRGLARWLFERQLCPGEDRIDEVHIDVLREYYLWYATQGYKDGHAVIS